MTKRFPKFIKVGLTALALVATLFCLPIRAHAGLSAPCAEKLEKKPAAEQLLDLFTSTYEAADLRLAEYSQLEKSIVRVHSLSRFHAEIQELKEAIDSAFNAWSDSEPQTVEKLTARLLQINRRLGRLHSEVSQWLRRQTDPPWSEIRIAPELLVPNKIYEITADRGGRIRARFSRRLVEEFFWQDRDPLAMDAAQRALDALSRGFSSGIAGIGILPEVNGVKVMKLHFQGSRVGAYRVFGICDREKELISFVTWDNDSGHDARYINKVSTRAINAYKNETWQ